MDITEDNLISWPKIYYRRLLNVLKGVQCRNRLLSNINDSLAYLNMLILEDTMYLSLKNILEKIRLLTIILPFIEYWRDYQSLPIDFNLFSDLSLIYEVPILVGLLKNPKLLQSSIAYLDQIKPINNEQKDFILMVRSLNGLAREFFLDNFYIR